MMFANSTRTLARKAAMVASSVAPSSAASVGRRAMEVSSRRIPRSFRSTLVEARGFSTIPTDDSNGEAKQEQTITPPPLASAAEIVQDDDDDYDDVLEDSPSEAEDADHVASAVSDENDNTADELNKNLKPSEIVEALDRHIVGQPDAKKSVAIAMRNRWRRRQLPEDLRKEVTPRNVLLVGPTG